MNMATGRSTTALGSRSFVSLPFSPSPSSSSLPFSAVKHHLPSSQIAFRHCNGRSSAAAATATVLLLRSSLFAGLSNSCFFNGEAQIREHVGDLVSSCRSRAGYGGGALGAQMNIFERVVRIVRSYANAIISSAEDPEKILDQTVLEMNEDLIKLRQASAQVLASQKQLENKCKAAKQTSDDWYRRAKLALEKGEENLAREALKRRKDYEDSAQALKFQLEQQKGVVEKLISNTRLLESKIQEAKSKKDTLKARAQSAKTSQKVNEMLGNINTSSALAAFEKMEEKVLALESQADSLNELSTDDLASKFEMLESGGVDDDLTALKQEMLGTKRPGELPVGRSPVSTTTNRSTVYPFQDIEIEKELNELRRKTSEL